MKSGWEATREEEIRILRRFDAVVAIQEEEAKVFREMMPDKKVITAGISFPVREPSKQPEAGRVLFIGGQNIANVQGITHFIERIWPRVKAAHPAAELDICGSVGALVESCPRGVTVSGFVESVDEAYDRVSVVINPIWTGSGLKIKTAEALSYSKALVTTECGVEGMAPRPEGACRIAQDDAAVAENILDLLKSAEKRKAQEAAAGEYARKYLTPENVYRELDSVIREVAGT